MVDCADRLAALTLLAWILGAADSNTSRAAELVIPSVVLAPMVEAETPARQTGVVDRIDVAEGTFVKRGTVLAALDPRAAVLAVQQAQLEHDQMLARVANQLRIQYAEKALDVARAELKRSEESISKFPKSISRSQLDVEQLTVEKLQLERRQAEHDLTLEQFELKLKQNALAAAELTLELHAVRAPFDGVVALVRARPGEWVETGTAVCRLVAVDALRAEGFVDARQLQHVSLGSPVQFAVDDAPDRSHRGVLRYIGPEEDPVTRQTRVWAEIDNSQRKLRPGQRGELRLEPLPTPGDK
jgi:RND family efflux transporter MFP subunit